MVKPEAIKTLRDWARRWPATGNLGFDPETREPAVFDTAGADRKQVKKFAWERAGDTLTILAQPERFSQQAISAATGRIGKIREQRTAYETAAADQLRTAERALLDAWQAYRAAEPASRAVLRRDVLTAERAITAIETALAAQVKMGREIQLAPSDGEMVFTVYVPPMPLDRRGIPISAAAAAPEV